MAVKKTEITGDYSTAQKAITCWEEGEARPKRISYSAGQGRMNFRCNSTLKTVLCGNCPLLPDETVTFVDLELVDEARTY